MHEAYLAMNFVLGVLLRVGVPLALTLVAALWLRRLDRRWQRDADEIRRAVGSKSGLGVIRCWLLHDCAPERREACPAFLDQKIPCWQHFRDGQGRLAHRCLGCEVFRRWMAPKVA